ncbi:MAG: serine/threonine-protein kinase [Anaerolineae bacterium]|nr:serine/threonine-protein kinase [Anaerolineae bacterium]
MSDDRLVGRQLGNYRLERMIGRGGMAQVYYGLDVRLKRPVAIKVIDARYRDDPGYARRFLREAQTVATWRHEHIVQVYFADEQDDLYYFAMEYIEGKSLAALLREVRAAGELLSPAEVLRVGHAIASALDYAHAKGVIHRDVKPGNVLVSNDGRVVLTDFGLAMDVHEGTQGQVFGSSHYIAPEQARRSGDAVAQSDLYSLGVVLFELLTGSVPFDDPSPTSVALQHVTLDPPLPSEINPLLNQATEVVLLKALSKAPAERYQTGRELMAALMRAIEGSESPSPVQETTGQDALLGKTLDEYRVDTLLGRGGMARIYRGVDVRLQRQVAIKVIDTPFQAEAQYITRFEREARAIAQLEHPGIVRLYRYGEANGVLYMAMQYVEGSDLRVLLDSHHDAGTRMPVEQAVHILGQVCHALDFAHSRGVVHRDVKPSNILLDSNGDAILTDFGLALLSDAGTRGEILGSLHYIAPEQAISSAAAVPQSDLYAVGVVLYEMLTGQVPFDAEDPLDIALLHMSEVPRPPRTLCPNLSPEVELVVLRTLAKEPGDRYASGAELIDDLKQALKGAAGRERDRAHGLPPIGRMEDMPLRPLPPMPAAIVDVERAQAVTEPKAPGQRARPVGTGRRMAYAATGSILVLLALIAVLLVSRDGGLSSVPTATSTAVARVAQEGGTLVPPMATETVRVSVTPSRTTTSSPTARPTRRATATPTPTWTAMVIRTADLPATETGVAPVVAGDTPMPTTETTPTVAPSVTEEAAGSPTATRTSKPGVRLTATPTTSRPSTPAPAPTAVTLSALRGWILFLSDRDGEQAVYAMQADGSGTFRLHDRRIYYEAAAVEARHPEGSLWLEVREHEGNLDIWRVGLGEDRVLTTSPADDYDPAWSPDGRQIVFVSGRAGSDDLFVMDAEITGERQVTFYTGFDKRPTWSPDGTRIAFWSDRDTGHPQIWVINVDLTGLVNLSNNPFNDWDPVWVK